LMMPLCHAAYTVDATLPIARHAAAAADDAAMLRFRLRRCAMLLSRRRLPARRVFSFRAMLLRDAARMLKDTARCAMFMPRYTDPARHGGAPICRYTRASARVVVAR